MELRYDRIARRYRTATHCNTLQHPSTPCNTLQHRVQRHRSFLKMRLEKMIRMEVRIGDTKVWDLFSDEMSKYAHCSTLQHTATHLSKKPCVVFTAALKYTATHCNTL